VTALISGCYHGAGGAGDAMRLAVIGLALIGFACAGSGCVPVYNSSISAAGPRVDPEEAAERALIGATLGTALGTGLGAGFAINPAIGAVIGAETGATLGAATGIITTQPLPAYKQIAAPATPAIPEFYDTWPPGYHIPAAGSQTPPPPPG
jgi:hypothetical protein